VPALGQLTLMARVLKGEAIGWGEHLLPVMVCVGLVVLALGYVTKRMNVAAQS
jgi:sodium transport system permease protein